MSGLLQKAALQLGLLPFPITQPHPQVWEPVARLCGVGWKLVNQIRVKIWSWQHKAVCDIPWVC